MKPRILARATLFVLGVALALVGVVPLLVVDDLPDPLASQWSFDGEVTSTMSPGALLALVAVLLGPTALTLVVVAFTTREARTGSRVMWVGGAALLGVVIAGASLATVLVNRGHATAADVAGMAVWPIVVVTVVSLAVGALAAWAAAGLPEAPRPPVTTRALDVPETTVVAWSRNLTVRWLVVLSAVMVAVGVGLAVLNSDWWLGLFLIVTTVPAALLSRIEVFADRRGLTVTYGPWGWPRTRIPLDRIAAAEAIDVDPATWGGWGYRGSVKLFRQAAVVLRAGPGLRLDLVDGRRFAVTIDDPETAAAVLTRELQRC